MSVVTGALESLAPKLLQLLHDEYRLQKGVKKQVQWLHSELKSIYAFLNEVADVPWDRLNSQVKVWAREVREASYDMEDVLDSYLVRVDGGETADPSRLKRALKKMGKVFTKTKARRSIAGAIEDNKNYLEEIAERRQRYKLDEIMSKQVTTTSNIDPRLNAMYKEVTQLIGIDESKDDVISLLNPSSTQNDVGNKILKKVSIVGVGGLGKTTLAKAVYDKLSSEFECRAFVSVGRDRDLVTVFKDILFHLDKAMYHNIHNTRRGAHLLIDELREFLENKRYFIVVDDVWDVDTCKRIKLALVENYFGSILITTTRKFDVAEEAGVVYKLKPLSYEDSKKLLYTRIFGAEGQHLDNKPDDVSDKIIKRCAGITLAITTVASLLAGKPKDEWSEVYSSIGFSHKDNTDVEDTMTILSFSYYDMPSHLRTCLLYLSTYPEDRYIEKDKLIWKWIAEGFVHEKQGERLFDVGERYFNDLINRSMIQAVDSQLDDNVSSCRVHDIVLDLLRKFSFEENFVAILDGNAKAVSSPSNVRRFALHNRTADHVSSEAKVSQMPKVRSYIAFGCYFNNNNWGHISSFKLLRVLHLIACSFEEDCHLEFPLSDLLHIRYLGIRCEGSIPKLSKQITNLKLLHTLVRGSLPVSTVLPAQLLCLDARSPWSIGNLTSLEELTMRDGDPKMFVKELGSLRQLRVLRIYDIGFIDKSMRRDFVVSLSNLQKLQYLSYEGSVHLHTDIAMWEAEGFVLPRSLRHLALCIIFSNVPSCINHLCLPNLSFMTLWVDTIDEQAMKHLARLPALSWLYLAILSAEKAINISVSGDGCFPKLRLLHINAMIQFQQHNMEDSSISLHIWNRAGPMPFGSRKSNCSKNVPCAVMPKLERLRFNVPLRVLKDNNYDCSNIGLEYLPSIRELMVWMDFEGMSAEEVDTASAALRNACKVHPNNPTLYVDKDNEEKMVSTQDAEDEKQQQEVEVEAEVGLSDG